MLSVITSCVQNVELPKLGFLRIFQNTNLCSLRLMGEKIFSWKKIAEKFDHNIFFEAIWRNALINSIIRND